MIETKFNIGDKAWYASFDPKKVVKVPCSICNGNKKVTLILGNGDHMELPCDHCTHGYNPPTGIEEVPMPVNKPNLIIISGIDIRLDEEKQRVEYLCGAKGYHTIYHEENLFETYEEAFEKGKELMAEWLKDEKKKADHIKVNKLKNYSWNAGYHRKAARDALKKYEYHSERAKLCQEKAKKGKDQKHVEYQV